jgi:hypothetical protein
MLQIFGLAARAFTGFFASATRHCELSEQWAVDSGRLAVLAITFKSVRREMEIVRKRSSEEVKLRCGVRGVGLGVRRDSEKAQRGVSLLEEPGPRERAVAIFEVLLLSVLGNYKPLGREQGGEAPAEERQCGLVGPGRVVGRVEEDQIEGNVGAHAAEDRLDAPGVDGDTGGDAKVGEILAQDGQGHRTSLDKIDLRRAAAVRFKPDRTRTGKEIEEADAHNPRGQDIEQGLAQPVAGGPGGEAGRSLKPS